MTARNIRDDGLAELAELLDIGGRQIAARVAARSAPARNQRALPADAAASLEAIRAELEQLSASAAGVRAEIASVVHGAVRRFRDGSSTLAELVSTLNVARSRARRARVGDEP